MAGNTNQTHIPPQQTPGRRYKKNDQKGDIPWWLIIILCLTWTPAGLLLLFVKVFLLLFSGGINAGQSKTGKASTSSAAPSAAPQTPVAKKWSRGRGLGLFLKVLGGFLLASAIIVVLATFGDALSYGWSRYMFDDLTGAAFTGLGGLVSIIAGQNNTRRANQYRKYTAIVGQRDSMKIIDIAAAMPTSYKKACKDMQRLIDQGAFGPDAYLDLFTHNFMRNSLATPVTEAETTLYAKTKLQTAKSTAAAEPVLSESDSILAEIRRLNDEIADESVSHRISRIEKITADIFRLVNDNPAKRSQAKTFLDYYLPTTLKLLNAYSQFEDQAVDGENIRAAKENIESILDSLVQGFELQLDRLFEADAMDISGDIRVLEQMMARDGLTQKHTMASVASAAAAANQKAAADQQE